MKIDIKLFKQCFLVMLTATFVIAVPSVFAHGAGHKAMTNAPAALSMDEHEFGIEGAPQKVTRSIAIAMNDTMRFDPSSIKIKRGDTIKFMITNKGTLVHEMVLGTIAALKEHGELMKQNPDMEHDEPYMVHVPPGGTMVMALHFTKAGQFYFGCLAPGHFEAGMIGKIKVVK